MPLGRWMDTSCTHCTATVLRGGLSHLLTQQQAAAGAWVSGVDPFCWHAKDDGTWGLRGRRNAFCGVAVMDRTSTRVLGQGGRCRRRRTVHVRSQSLLSLRCSRSSNDELAKSNGRMNSGTLRDGDGPGRPCLLDCNVRGTNGVSTNETYLSQSCTSNLLQKYPTLLIPDSRYRLMAFAMWCLLCPSRSHFPPWR